MKLKTDFVREQFQAFSEPSLKRTAHFENAGGSFMCRQVAHILSDYHARLRVQPYYAYLASKEAGQAMDKSYQVLAEILNVPNDWVHVGPSTSANTFTLSHAFDALINEGSNIVVTNQDHEANSGFWRRMEKRGVQVREWSVGQNGLLDTATLWPLVDSHTIFVAFPHVSNIVGAINPVAEICTKLNSLNVYSIVDGVSYVPHAWPDISELRADIYVFSAYKTYGPHQGVMTINPELAAKLENQAHYFNAEYFRKRFNPAGPDHAQVAALAGMGDYIAKIYKKHFGKDVSLTQMARDVSALQRSHETKKLTELLEGLRALNSVKIIGDVDVDARVPTISLVHDSKTGNDMAKALRKHGVMAAGGNFYAPRVLEAMGIDPEHGVLRLSFVHYGKSKDMEHVLKALKAVLAT